jgi:hypothetical protein
MSNTETDLARRNRYLRNLQVVLRGVQAAATALEKDISYYEVHHEAPIALQTQAERVAHLATEMLVDAALVQHVDYLARNREV